MIKLVKYKEWTTKEGLLKIQGWAHDGLTNEQIAHNIGVRVETLYDWQNKYPKFSNALKKGKEVVDREVENSLLKRANGYVTVDHQYKIVDVDDNVLWARRNKAKNEYKLKHPEATDDEIKEYAYEKVPTRERIELYQNERTVPPDTTAMIFWLKNRKPSEWRDRRETELSGSLDTNPHILNKMSDEEVAKIARERLERQSKVNRENAEKAKRR